jgi:hypothetical protein
VTKTAPGSLRVAFTAPANNGAAITRYNVACTSAYGGVSGAKSAAAGPIVVTTLTTGKIYTCTVSATNARGTGRASIASAAVTA